MPNIWKIAKHSKFKYKQMMKNWKQQRIAWENMKMYTVINFIIFLRQHLFLFIFAGGFDSTTNKRHPR